jgi:radical SAM/Cys-rich protein
MAKFKKSMEKLNDTFQAMIENHKGDITPISLDILQVNIGLRCNKKCSHCHVKAGPERDEQMDLKTIKRIIELVDTIKPKLLDITGGAPELHPNLKEFITMLDETNQKNQVRTNLSALLENEELIEFFSSKQVKLIASLPCYEAAEVDSIRGEGTFMQSIEALWKVNEAGYGIDAELELDLVFNPEGDFLPPSQTKLEKTFHKRLQEDFGIKFTNLLTITNMPIGRFRENLLKNNKLSEYMRLLRESFNPETLTGLMCRSQVCVNWDGYVYDCDFNLAQNLVMEAPVININDINFNPTTLLNREIVVGDYCFGCTAGQGSSCGGALLGG